MLSKTLGGHYSSKGVSRHFLPTGRYLEKMNKTFTEINFRAKFQSNQVVLTRNLLLLSSCCGLSVLSLGDVEMTS